jgi:hypothetical protein
MTGHKQALVAAVVAGAGAVLITLGTATVGMAQQPGSPAVAVARTLVSPVRGEAEIAYTKPNVQRKGATIVTTIRVKNISPGPIAGFRVDEFWYDKAGETVAGSPTFRLRKPLMPNEVVDVVLTVPVNPKMDRNQYKFEHANGKIKPKLLPKI